VTSRLLLAHPRPPAPTLPLILPRPCRCSACFFPTAGHHVLKPLEGQVHAGGRVFDRSENGRYVWLYQGSQVRAPCKGLPACAYCGCRCPALSALTTPAAAASIVCSARTPRSLSRAGVEPRQAGCAHRARVWHLPVPAVAVLHAHGGVVPLHHAAPGAHWRHGGAVCRLWVRVRCCRRVLRGRRAGRCSGRTAHAEGTSLPPHNPPFSSPRHPMRTHRCSVVWLFGYELWIVPNLWSDTISIMDAFKPLYSFDKSEGGNVRGSVIGPGCARREGCGSMGMARQPAPTLLRSTLAPTGTFFLTPVLLPAAPLLCCTAEVVPAGWLCAADGPGGVGGLAAVRVRGVCGIQQEDHRRHVRGCVAVGRQAGGPSAVCREPAARRSPLCHKCPRSTLDSPVSVPHLRAPPPPHAQARC
jgi:hypothetical protein